MTRKLTTVFGLAITALGAGTTIAFAGASNAAGGCTSAQVSEYLSEYRPAVANRITAGQLERLTGVVNRAEPITQAELEQAIARAKERNPEQAARIEAAAAANPERATAIRAAIADGTALSTINMTRDSIAASCE